jgi:hypothetical protein
MNTTQTQTVKGQLLDLIYQMDRDELVILNNEYCQSINAMDSEIWSNDQDFLETFFHNNPDNLARAIFYGDYRYSDDLVRFNGYGNLETFNHYGVNDMVELVDVMAEYIEENSKDFSQFDQIEFN